MNPLTKFAAKLPPGRLSISEMDANWIAIEQENHSIRASISALEVQIAVLTAAAGSPDAPVVVMGGEPLTMGGDDVLMA